MSKQLTTTTVYNKRTDYTQITMISFSLCIKRQNTKNTYPSYVIFNSVVSVIIPQKTNNCRISSNESSIVLFTKPDCSIKLYSILQGK